MKIAFIGKGAMAQFAAQKLEGLGHCVTAYVVRSTPHDAEGNTRQRYVTEMTGVPRDTELIVECAGHHALATHGADALRGGFDVISVSLGALADRALEADLTEAAQAGGAVLTVVAGAIGGLDALRAARAGSLRSVRYVGRKPPLGWTGSAAEARLDLEALTDAPATHFVGSAREAALAYPKNANVAAAVALAGLGFDKTQAELIADPTISANTHSVFAEGDFGHFEFQISGCPLASNPKTSALAAMSVVNAVHERAQVIRF